MVYAKLEEMMMEAVVIMFATILSRAAQAQQDCPFNYTTQPPTYYPCNPYIGTHIELPCAADNSYYTDWYYTKDPASAGYNGIKLVNDDGIYSFNFYLNSKQPQLLFIVSSETVGFYWCAIRDDGARASTVTSICDADFYNMSLPLCQVYRNDLRYEYAHRVDECGAIDSPTDFPRPPLPDDCVVVAPSSSILYQHSSNDVTATISTNVLSSSTVAGSSAGLATSSDVTSSLTLTTSSISLTPSSISLSSSPTPTSSVVSVNVSTTLDQTLLLYILVGVCGLLLVIAVVIIIIIVVLCKLNNSHTSNFPASKSEEVEGVTWDNDRHVKTISYSPDEKDHNGTVNRDLSITNPNYEINHINISQGKPSSPTKYNMSGSITPSSLDGRSHCDPIYANATIPPPPMAMPSKYDEDYEQLDDLPLSPQPMYAVLENPDSVQDPVTTPPLATPPGIPARPRMSSHSDGVYDTPWGTLPAGIQRSLSLSRSKSQSSHPTSSVVLEDPEYDILHDDNDDVYSSIPA